MGSSVASAIVSKWRIAISGRIWPPIASVFGGKTSRQLAPPASACFAIAAAFAEPSA